MATAFTDPSALLDFPAFRSEMAFPLLTDSMIETIRTYASEVREPAGNTIFFGGQRSADMFVVLEGNVNIYTGDEENTSETVIDLGPNQFTGELNMLKRSTVACRSTRYGSQFAVAGRTHKSSPGSCGPKAKSRT